ncbi:DUF2778 domain-containing protein [Methylobacterium mesophilicum SR1.6/6]|uniref:DUF2778 domain-containing protein n=1 Tax=Methylobacterium mesophilicum SR1.6/6 TaxID=908290 RepID=A0A6B9FKU2_9HYPH|nr:DUF2778 domain-containing protein [Methylobacterium mesophilicum]QGY02997.1 DUF2778 domain-containing protein [Methylobacterium mesophilicum SR1.6/6]
MTIDSVPLDGRGTRSARRACVAPLGVLTGAILLAALGSNQWHFHQDTLVSLERVEARSADGAAETAGSPAERDVATAGHETTAPGVPAVDAWREATGGPLSRWAWAQTVLPALPPDHAVEDESRAGVQGEPEAGREFEAQPAEPPLSAMMVPLPIPRPPEFRGPGAAATARRAERRMSRRELPPAQPTAPAVDDRSFLEKFFGIERAPALAYTALESKPIDVAPQRRITPPLPMAREPGATAGIAVYNIAARTVTLPNGERLEAHSGLGEGLDEPRLVNVRMRGPTPPGTYDLTEREALFHGVRAIRLTPVGGSEAVYGRVGLLAHTYMLGPRGDSNGCVSFRDYNRFLEAFLRGEVQRLVVVSGSQDPLPALAAGTVTTRMARNGS